MGLNLDWGVILAYGAGLLMIYLLARILFVPLKLLWRLIYSALIGALALWLINLVGGFFDFSIPINPITALVVGFLGIPGVILLVVLQFMIK